MEKATFLDILEQIVGGFEDPAFRTNYAHAKSQGNVPSPSPYSETQSGFCRELARLRTPVGLFAL